VIVSVLVATQLAILLPKSGHDASERSAMEIVDYEAFPESIYSTDEIVLFPAKSRRSCALFVVWRGCRER
jgi:hypothetical protein